MTPAEVIAIVKDTVVTVAAGIAAYVGIRGLNTWRRQLSGNAEYQLARTILSCIFELRDAIHGARSGFMMHSPEPDLPRDELENLSREEKEWHANAQAYQRRWDPIQAARSKLATSLWEAEAVWDATGREIMAKALELNRMLSELQFAIEEHLEAKNPANRHRPAEPRQEYLDRRKVLYERSKDDEFNRKLDAIIKDIEQELRPHITGHYR